MDFNTFIANFFASLFLVVQRMFLLIFLPYKTMRKISQEQDWMQVSIIWALVFIYFYCANALRNFEFEPVILYVITLIDFILSVYFFYKLSQVFRKEISFNSFIMTFSYVLIPTLVWFSVNSFLYWFIPPPRTMSTLGKAFSIFYIAFSVSILLWKIILWFLALRFSSKQSFFHIIYMMLIYLAIFLPYALVLYVLKLSKIPFI